MRWRRRDTSGEHPALDVRVRDGFVAFDTETTGMDARSDRIVSVAAVRFEAGVEADSFESLVDPGRPIPASSTRVHGIDDAAVRGAPSIEEVLPPFREFIGAGVPVAHMAAFDLAFLRAPLARVGAPALERILDTSVLAARLLPPMPELSLDALCSYFAIEPRGRHTAVGDARLAAQILMKLLPELERRGAVTLESALHWGDVTRTP